MASKFEPQVELRRDLQRIFHGHGMMDSPQMMDSCSCAADMRALLQTLAAGVLPDDPFADKIRSLER